MRCHPFHLWMAEEISVCLRAAGAAYRWEHPFELPDGTKNFVDIFAYRGELRVLIEIETTPRNALSNALKAAQVGLPLWIVVPDLRVRTAVGHRLASAGLRVDGDLISILLLRVARRAVFQFFGRFPLASRDAENTANAEQCPPPARRTPEGQLNCCSLRASPSSPGEPAQNH